MDDDYGGNDNPGHYYVRASYPFKITYPKNEIEFVTEARQDYKIRQGTGDIFVGNQVMFAMNRIKKIIVKRQNSANSWKNVKVYILEYKYGYDSSVQTESNPVSGGVIHSLLTKITVWSSDPDTDTSAKKLPSYTFSYGADCDTFKGGCPLYAMTQMNSTSQYRTPNDFFLLSADNGFKGRTEFQYWSNGQALNVKYCDPDKFTLDGKVCKTDNELNTQRHRLAIIIGYDGMGNWYKTDILYTTNQPLAYVKNYKEDYTDGDGDRTINNFSGYEFLGYPEVDVKVYEKNISTEVATHSKTYYRQALDTPSCFKPSPLKGIAFITRNYDADNTSHYTESMANYRVRFGPMFDEAGWTETDDDQLNGVCTTYDPEETVSLPFPDLNIQKIYISSQPALCTKSMLYYLDIDGGKDPYQNPKILTNYGKVSCVDPYNDDSSDITKYSLTYYTNAIGDNSGEIGWLTPKPKESWISDSPNPYTGTKYNHTRTYYDNLGLGQIQSGKYLNVTKTEIMKDGASYASTTYSYDFTYPWQQNAITDPLNNTTTTSYDTHFRIYPKQVTNAAGHVSQIDYDFNTIDNLPNKGGALGLPVKTTDPNGSVTYTVYDVFGRVKEVYLPGKSPLSSQPSQVFGYYYFNENDGISPCTADNNCLIGLGVNNTPKMITSQAVRFVDGADYDCGKLSGSYSMFDGFGQKVQTRSTWIDNEWDSLLGIPVASEGLKDIVASTSYNALGQIQYQTLPYTVTPGIKYPTTAFVAGDFASYPGASYTYDGLGRSSETLYPESTPEKIVKEKIVYEFGGNPLETQLLDKNCNDGNSATYCTEKITKNDAFGRVLSTREVEQGGPNTYTTSYTLHPVLDTPTEVKDTNGNIVSKVSYNTLGQKIKMWDIDMSPKMTDDANSWRYEYNLLGSLTKQTNPKNIVSSITYDSIQRPTKKTVSGNTVSETTYDICEKGKGKICKTVSYDPQQSGKKLEEQSFKYNNRGLVTEETKILSNMPDTVINNKYFTTKYSYDEGGRIKDTTLPSNSTLGIGAETLTYSYNRLYLSYIRSSIGSVQYIKNAAYNKNGQLTTTQAGNGITSHYSYIPGNLRLTEFSVSDDIINLYSYDPLGNITNIDDYLRENNDPYSFDQTFTYDYLSRLKSVTGAYTASFTYDKIGNIKSKVEGNNNIGLYYGIYNPGGINYYHRPQSVTIGDVVSTLQYDEVGNLIKDYQNTYTYDADNHLIKSVPIGTPTPTLIPTSTPTPTPPPPNADANGDGYVDMLDYQIWKQHYGEVLNTPDNSLGDFNFDKTVDGLDYNIWRANYGTSGPTATPFNPIYTPTPTIALPSPTPVQNYCLCSGGKVYKNLCDTGVPCCTSKNSCVCTNQCNPYY